MTRSTRPRHTARWIAGATLLVLAIVGVVLATRTPQQATQVDSPLLGQVAPQFTGTDLRTGAPVSLRSLRGHYVVVNFFAGWCDPCIQEAPDLVHFDYEQAHLSDGARLISVVFHDPNSDALQFLKSQGALWPAVGDPGGNIAQSYGVTSPPTTFVINPSGRISVNPYLGPANLGNLKSMLLAAHATNSVTSRG
jgi:peroxiredoxin